MEHFFIFLALTLPVVKPGEWNTQSSACSIGTCQCMPSPNSVYPDVICFISSITSSDTTITALPADIQSLILSCGNSKSLSILTDDIFHKFSQLRLLKIHQCNVNVITAKSFRGLDFLENLSISESALPLMDTKTFLHLPHIQFLSIINCNISFLPDISYLKSLQYLNASHNNLHQVKLEAPSNRNNITHGDNLYDLKIIDLSYNNISSTPLELISRTPHVQQLYLKGLLLTELFIPENIQLKDLLVLDVKESHLTAVDLSGLNMATGIKELHLEGDGLPVNFSGLSHLASLEKLLLNNFAISDTIWQQLNFTLLARLSLTNNNLTTIDVSYLPALRLLEVAINNISHLNNATFSNQNSLLLVNISHNSIQDLPANIFQKNFNLKALDFSGNNILALQSRVFMGLDQLFYLDLSNNLITSLPYTIFKDLSMMNYLYIRNNTLRFLPKLSYMQELITLDISHNKISSILSNDLSGLGRLESLFVNNNRLTILPPDLLSPCPNILQVWFNDNKISDIGTFGAHPKLISLRLDNNQITDFVTESPFVHLQKLEYLFLDGNNLTTLDSNIFPASIQVIFLNENYFEFFQPTSFNYLPHLSIVSLTNNKRVLSIPQNVVDGFKSLISKPIFNVERNFFLCDCDLGYLKVISEDEKTIPVLSQFYPRFNGIENSKCYTPFEGGTIRNFKDVPLSHFACAYSETWCDVFCGCCSEPSNCECLYSCPSECTCYYGGSSFKKNYIHIHCRSKNLEKIPKGIPSRTVSLYLDGNKFNHLLKQDFNHLQDTEDIYLNNSHIKSIDNGAFENISELKLLLLNDNQLTSIGDNFLGKLKSIKQIYLHNNLIDIISSDAFSELSSVETITLHNNRLLFLKAALKIPHPMSLTLSGNPWLCNCEVSKTDIRTLYEIKKFIVDIDKMCCFFYNNSYLSDLSSQENSLSLKKNADINESFTESTPTESMEDKHNLFSYEYYNYISQFSDPNCLPIFHFNYEDYCTPSVSNATFLKSTSNSGFHSGFIGLIVITVILLLFAATVVIVLLKRQEFQAWVFVNLGVRILDKKVHMDSEDAGQKVFDAFISYSSKDEEFVATTLVPKLENGDKKYRLCVHYRDFPVGRNITNTICRAIENSSRTILLLSVNFLSSEWCRFEFQTAHHHIIREGSHRLIIVILGDVPEEMLDPDLKMHLKSKTYLKYGDRWFWEKLFFAMPSIKDRPISNDDPRADILQRMQVLAKDELHEEINIPDMPHHNQEATDQILRIFNKKIDNGHIQNQWKSKNETQDDDLVDVRTQLAPYFNFGFVNTNDVNDNVHDTVEHKV